MKRIRNWLLFIVMVLIWGSSWSVVRSAVGYIGPFNIVLYRSLFSAIVLPFYLVLVLRKTHLEKRNILDMIVMGGFIILTDSLRTIGLIYETSGIGAVLTYTQPFFVFLLAAKFLNEKPKIIRFLGIFIGFLGVVALLARQGTSDQMLNYSVPIFIGSAFVWALSVIYYRKFLTGVNPVLTSIFIRAFGIVLIGLPQIEFGEVALHLSTSLPLILYLSVIASGVAPMIWYFLLREEEVTVISSSSLLVPMTAFMFGWLLIGENLEIRTLLGVAMILSGVYITNKS